MIKAIGFAAFVLLTAIASKQSEAEPYQWCANDGASRSGGLSCSYTTLQQCQAAVSGSGAFCSPNYFEERDGRIAQATTTGAKSQDEKPRGKIVNRHREAKKRPRNRGEDDYVYGKLHYRVKPAK